MIYNAMIIIIITCQFVRRHNMAWATTGVSDESLLRAIREFIQIWLRRLLNAVTVSDDRMSTGKLFHTSGPATANARLPNLTRTLGTRRSPRPGGRVHRSSCWHGGDLDAHVSDVGWCETMCGLVHQQTQLERYSLSDTEPMQVVAQQRSDVVAASAAIYDSSGAVQDALQLV